MSFVQLKPAARHLRRIAKAHAAGEIPRQHYRRARRTIIEELHVNFSDSVLDGQAPLDRFALNEDETRRRRATEGYEAAIGASRAHLEQEHRGFNTKEYSRCSKSRLNPRSSLRALLVLSLGVFIALGVMAASAANIPSVSERDPNPNNSLVLPIESLRVKDAIDLPELRIDEVESFLAEELKVARAESRADRSGGFTAAELSEFADLLHRLGVQSEQGLPPSANIALNALAQRQLARRGVSVVQLDRIAERLEQLYRDRGYLAARAFVPAQEVKDNQAVISLLPGRLARVEIDSSTRLAKLVQKSYSGELHKVASRQSLEDFFYKLNSLPGVRASGSLGAGEEVGETFLALAIQNPQELNSTFSVDNFGDERSSRYRLKSRVDWLNPTGGGDSIAFNAALRVDPEEVGEFSVRYQRPVARLGDTLTTSVSHSNFEVQSTFSDEVIRGRTQTFDVGINRLLRGSRIASLSIGASAAVQRIKFADTQQELWWLQPEAQLHRVFEQSRWVLRSGATVTAGRLSSGRFSGQPAFFAAGSGWVSAWKPLGQQSIRLDLSAQFGTKDLPDSHKFRLGGVGRNSSIRPGSFIADSAIFAGAELSVTPNALREFGEFHIFTQLGHGQVQISRNAESAFVWDGGVTWRFPEFHQVSGGVRLSFPFATNGFEDSHDSARLLFDLTWTP